jgi:transposase
MSNKEIHRLEVIQKLLNRELTQTKAAECLDISVRQVQRILKLYHKQGAQGLISKQRGKPSNHSIPDILKEYALSITKTY